MELFKNGKLQEHYRNPRNAGCMENADGKGRSMNPVTGDVIEMYLRIDGSRIIDARFKAFGSPFLIAISSLLTETVKGSRIEDAPALLSEVLDGITGELPPGDIHCLALAREAFINALDDYSGRNAIELKAAAG